MRASTLVFLALFGAFALRERVHVAGAAGSCSIRVAPSPTPPRSSARAHALQDEVDRLERRSRDLERSLQAVTRSAVSLRELARRHSDAGVRAELAEIEAGVARLRELRDRTEIDRVAAAARLQLVRAGLDPGAPEPRSSPVEALGTDLPAPRVTSRAR